MPFYELVHVSYLKKVNEEYIFFIANTDMDKSALQTMYSSENSDKKETLDIMFLLKIELRTKEISAYIDNTDYSLELKNRLIHFFSRF